SGAPVKAGGKFATSVTFVSSTQLTARTPAMPVGGYPVLVYNPNGLWGNTAHGFLYVSGATRPAPHTLTSVEPATREATMNLSAAVAAETGLAADAVTEAPAAAA